VTAFVSVLATGPSWPLVFSLIGVAVVLTVVGLILLVRNRGGRP